VAEFKFRSLTFADWAAVDASKIQGLDKSDGLSLNKNADGSYTRDGRYSPDSLDSGLPDCRWHRIVIDADIPRNSYLEMKVHTSDNSNPNNLLPETLEFGDEIKDRLIRADSGRYIRLDIGFHGDGKETPVLRQVKIYYPSLSYLRYLPAIYQEDAASRDFLERYLSVYETQLHEIEETISNLPVYFDPMAAPDEFLEWLASWLALDRYELLGEKNREFILRAFEFYKQKGTASGLANLVSFLTGRECCVKEYMNNVFRSYGREHYEAEESRNAGRCFRFFHDVSKTVDTNPQHGMTSSMGKYLDGVHYIFDSRPDGRYSPHSVGLFIFLKPGETLLINEDELKRIIKAFLPVFIHVDIITVEFFEDSYSLSKLLESYKDVIYSRSEDKFLGVRGSYMDTASFHWLMTHKKGSVGGITNNTGFRTPHSMLSRPIPV
jgi:phage tail-like protein